MQRSGEPTAEGAQVRKPDLLDDNILYRLVKSANSGAPQAWSRTVPVNRVPSHAKLEDTGSLQKAKDSPALNQKILIQNDSAKPDSAKKNPVQNNSSQQLIVRKDSVRKFPVTRDSTRKSFGKKDSASGFLVKKNIFPKTCPPS